MPSKLNASKDDESISYSHSASEIDPYYSEYSYSLTGSRNEVSQSLEKTPLEVQEKGNKNDQAIIAPPKSSTDVVESYDYYSSSLYSKPNSKGNDQKKDQKSSNEYSYSEDTKDHNEEEESDHYYSTSYSTNNNSQKSKVVLTEKTLLSEYSYYSNYSNSSKAPSTRHSHPSKASQSSNVTEKKSLGYSGPASEYYSYDYSYSYSAKNDNQSDRDKSNYNSSYSYSTYGHTTTGKSYGSDTSSGDSTEYKEKKIHDTSKTTYYSYDSSYSSEADESADGTPSYSYCKSSFSKKKPNLGYSSISFKDSSYYSSYSTNFKNPSDPSTKKRSESYESSYNYENMSYTKSPNVSTPVVKPPPQILLSKQRFEDKWRKDDPSPESSISVTESTEEKTPREYLVLRAPERIFPSFDPPPSFSYISRGMTDDFIGNFIEEVWDYLRGAKKCLSSVERNCSEKNIKGSKTPPRLYLFNGESEFTPQSLLRSALKVLQLSRIERNEKAQILLKITDQRVYENTFRSFIEQEVKKKLVNTFLLYDPYRAGELSLEKTLESLTKMGFASSPPIDFYRIRIGVKECLPALIIEYLPQNALLEKSSTVYFSVVELLQNRKTNYLPFRFSVSQSHLALGPESYKFVTSSTESTLRLKCYSTALVYLSSMIAQCTFRDRKGMSYVEYPHLLRLFFGILSTTKISNEQEGSLPSIFLSCAFWTIYNPIESLREYVSLGTEKNRKGEVAAESALMATIDIEKKKRRNVVPSIIDSKIVELTSSPDGVSLFEFTIEKVRVPTQLPLGCNPFCLVSVVSADSACLPALKIPVNKVRVSSKKGYTWTFKKKGESNSILAKVNDPTDRLYIECCFEKKDVVTLNGHPQLDSTVWCAGYTTTPLGTLKSTTLSVCEGSLLDPPSEEQINVASTGEGLTHSKKKSAPASDVKIQICSPTKDLKAQVNALPERCLLLKRQLSITISLRKALTHLGLGASCAAKAFAHQYARTAFFVASDIALLDLLEGMWKKKRSEMPAKGKKKAQHYALLQCCAMLAAAHNCGSAKGSKSQSFSKRIEMNAFCRSAPISCV